MEQSQIISSYPLETHDRCSLKGMKGSTGHPSMACFFIVDNQPFLGVMHPDNIKRQTCRWLVGGVDLVWKVEYLA